MLRQVVTHSVRLARRKSPAVEAVRKKYFSLQVVPEPTLLASWLEANKSSFAPPVMNKLMHRAQLSIMFVGGPNERTDFHLESGSEFFYQLRGSMRLPIVHGGRREVMHINEGEVFLLPSRIPHSPQRPEKGSIGLVVERERAEDEPPDGLRWYVDFETCKEVLWEQYFHCKDLGKDLVPVVKAFQLSEECRTGVPTGKHVFKSPPLVQDVQTIVPPPFNLRCWLDKHTTTLAQGGSLNLFEGHPDREFRVHIVGGESAQVIDWENETWLYQLQGDVTVELESHQFPLVQGACVVLPANVECAVRRPMGTIGMMVQNDPRGNSI